MTLSGGLNRILALAEESMEVSLYESPDAMTLKFNLFRASTVFLMVFASYVPAFYPSSIIYG